MHGCPVALQSYFSSVVTDEVIQSLLLSYQNDEKPFFVEERPVFPVRVTFDEHDLLRTVFFPRYFNAADITLPLNTALLRETLIKLVSIMYNGILPYVESEFKTLDVLAECFKKLASIRELLKKDVEAAFSGDPAATAYSEIIRCYPSMSVVVVQRVAHELYNLKVPVYPRELTELVNRLTSIDVHPGAKLGEYFFVDHGLGTVIGETAVIGNWCRLYQSVTLGALHFKQDEQTKGLAKGYKRHPTLGNNVVVGAGAKILGPTSIGDNVSIGANCWIQENIPDGMAVFIQEHPVQMKKPKRTTESNPQIAIAKSLPPTVIAPPATTETKTTSQISTITVVTSAEAQKLSTSTETSPSKLSESTAPLEVEVVKHRSGSITSPPSPTLMMMGMINDGIVPNTVTFSRGTTPTAVVHVGSDGVVRSELSCKGESCQTCPLKEMNGCQ